jgi:predicted ABC-type exoprotein transport system permease subunit
MNTNEQSVIQYSKKSKNSCIAMAFSIILILVFIVSPLKMYINPLMTHAVFFLITIILLFTIYNNYTTTQYLSTTTNSSLFSGEWSSVKTNVLGGYIFTILIAFLILTIIKMWIYPNNLLLSHVPSL